MTDTYPRRAEPLEVNEADDGLVVYDPVHDMVHHLNPSASIIFDLCDGTRGVDAIAQVLAEAYELAVPPHDAAVAGLRQLVDRGLVLWEGQGATEI